MTTGVSGAVHPDPAYVAVRIPRTGEPCNTVVDAEQAQALRTLLFAKGVYGSMNRIDRGWEITCPRETIVLTRQVAS